MLVTIYKTRLRVSDRLQANKSWKVSISEPHEGEGVPPVPTKKLFGFAQNPWVALAEAGGVRTPGSPPGQLRPCIKPICSFKIGEIDAPAINKLN